MPVTRTSWSDGRAVVQAIVSLLGLLAACGGGSRGHAGDTVRVDAIAGVDCAGTTASNKGLQRALDALAPTGQTLLIPAGCRLGLASPGGGNAAITLPGNVHIRCEHPSAGFFAQQQFCSGGTYPGAACNTSAECTGGGTCANSFGSRTASPCDPATCFAPSAGATYGMLKDASLESSNIVIENCSFWTSQADPYQRCVGGTSDGKPCRQECDDASTMPGLRCEMDTDCGVGHCLRTADCHAGGGTCTGAPHDASGNPAGKINPIDLSRTFNARLAHVSIYDHFSGDFGIRAGPQATLYDVNAARQLTDCSSPLPDAPSRSACFTTSARGCCYGAAVANPASVNAQPETAVTNDFDLGTDSHVLRCTGRGSTTSFLGGARTRIEDSTVWPPGVFGPGTAANGFSVGPIGLVTKSQALNLASGGTGIALTGGDASAIENRLAGAPLVGISMTGANAHATGNSLKGLDVENAIGIDVQNGTADVETNYIEGNSPTGIGVNVAGLAARVTGNHLSSSTGTLATGVKVGRADGTTISGNVFANLHDRCVWIASGIMLVTIDGNECTFPPSQLSPSYHPIHVLNDGGSQQLLVTNNIFTLGWRGYATGSSTAGLANVKIANNRFVALAGAPIAAGGAGIEVTFNYMNTGATRQGFGQLTCDASCSNRGAWCAQDSDCASCDGRVQRCIPEPLHGFVGSPTAARGVAHPAFVGNLMFNGGAGALKQCMGATTFVGSYCNVPSPTGECSGGAACSGGPPAICQGGPDVGKACCPGTSPTCAVRTLRPSLRVVDHGTDSGAGDFLFLGNTVLSTSPAQTDWVGIDMQSSAALGNIQLSNSQIADNIFDAASTTNTTAIRFPTAFAAITNVTIGNNHFNGWSTPASTGHIQNYQGGFGSLLLQNGAIVRSEYPLLGPGPQHLYSSIGGAEGSSTEARVRSLMDGSGTVWRMTCQIRDAPGDGSTRTFTLRRNAAPTAMTCTIAGTGTQCTPAAGPASAPIAFAPGDQLATGQVSTAAPSLKATQGACVLLVSYDTAM